MRHTALAFKPLGHEPGLLFGEPVTADDARKISGQRALVENIMQDGYWRTLPNLRTELKRQFGVFYAETSISARIRGLRAAGYTVTSRRTRPGSGLYEYRAVKQQGTGIREQGSEKPELPSAADLDAIAEEQAIRQATGTTEAAR